MTLVLNFLVLVVGFVLLIKGADWFVDGAAGIADKFGIPELVIGLTIVAFGTSAPEAAVSITAALKDTAESSTAGLAIGNVVGSNIMNILLILGITSAITPVPVQKSTFKYEIPFVLIITTILGVMGFIGGQVGRIDGIILWVIFALFFVYLIKMSKIGQTSLVEAPEGGEKKKKKSVWLLILLVLVGMGMIVLGSNMTVDSATKIAEKFGMSDRLIGLTIVAFGTSLPELVTSATAAKKGSADIAIGNIVGSNIFNILFVLSTTAIITPVPFASNFYIDTAVAAASVVMLWVCVANKERKLKRAGGISMLGCYAVYFVYLLMFTKSA